MYGNSLQVEFPLLSPPPPLWYQWGGRSLCLVPTGFVHAGLGVRESHLTQDVQNTKASISEWSQPSSWAWFLLASFWNISIHLLTYKYWKERRAFIRSDAAFLVCIWCSVLLPPMKSLSRKPPPWEPFFLMNQENLHLPPGTSWVVLWPRWS